MLPVSSFPPQHWNVSYAVLPASSWQNGHVAVLAIPQTASMSCLAPMPNMKRSMLAQPRVETASPPTPQGHPHCTFATTARRLAVVFARR